MIKFILGVQLIFFFMAGSHIANYIRIQRCVETMNVLSLLSIEKLGEIKTHEI